MTPEQRRVWKADYRARLKAGAVFRVGAPLQPVPHGQPHGAAAHRRRKETPCGPCVAAETAARKQRRATMADGNDMRLSAGTADDARIMRAGPDAELLFYRAFQLAKCETDGVLEEIQLIRISPKGKKSVAALEREGLLTTITPTGGFRIAGWLDWNDSLDKIEDKFRSEVFDADGYRCRACGSQADDLHLCAPCNLRKGDKTGWLG